MIPRILTEELRHRFAKLVSNHTIWLHTAQRLYNAAQVVAVDVQRRWNDNDFRKPPVQNGLIDDGFEISDIQPTFMMLIGFSIENLFKARLVQLRSADIRERLSRTGRLSQELLTHDLVELAAECGLALIQSETLTLDRLTKFSVWRGRYHFPLSFDVFYHLRSDSDSYSSGIAFRDDDIEKINSLTNSLSQRLNLPIRRRAAG